jgi:hypothetical protein
MNDLDSALLEAIPADARRILVLGDDLLRHRPLWQRRNPLALIATEPAENGPKLDAAILSLEGTSGDPIELVSRAASCLAPGGTLALFAAAYDTEAAIPALCARLAERGLVVDRLIGGTATGAPGILRFQLGPGPAKQIRILGNPFNYDPDPMRQSVVRVRLREPFEQLNSIPGMRCRVGTKHAIPPVDEPEAANILIFQRFLFDDPAAVMRATSGQGYITIAEFDDEPGRFRQWTESPATWSGITRFRPRRPTSPSCCGNSIRKSACSAIICHASGRWRPERRTRPSRSSSPL